MRHSISKWSFASLALVMTAQIAAVPAIAGVDSLRVHLKHGSTMDASQYTVDGATVHLSLVAGGSISFPASLVDRVETVRAETVAAPPDIPVEAPFVPAPLAAAQVVTTPVTDQAEVAVEGDSIEALIESSARRHNLEPDLLAAVIAVESGYNPSAVSPKGAQGLMQLMPGTAKDLAVTNPFDPRQNIEAGAKYLRQLLDQHDGSFVDALAAYNAGKGRVARYNGVPPYRETIAYINKVLKRYRTPQAVPAPRDASRAGR